MRDRKAESAAADLPQSLIETQHGKFWLPDSSYEDPILQAIRSNSLFDDHVVQALKPFVTAGSTVIDVGANFGQMCIKWSQMVGETGWVHAFEASKFIAHFLRKSMQANEHCCNVIVHENACWEVSGVDLNMLEPDGSNHGLFYSGMGIKSSFEGDTRNMSTHLATSLRIDDVKYTTPVSVIKIDAQGSDLYALRGARETIVKYLPLVAFEYEPHYNPMFNITWDDYHNFLTDLGYVQRLDIMNNDHDFCYIHASKNV